MKYLLLLLSFLSLHVSSLQAQENWVLEKDKDGIQIFTQKLAGQNLKNSRGIVTIDATPETVKAFIKQGAKHKDWMHTISISDVIEQNSEEDFCVYYIADAPWPVSDRDVISHWTIEPTENVGGCIFKTIGLPEKKAEKAGTVRIMDAWNSWEVIPLAEGKTKVILISHADPGGSIPDWLANTTATDTPHRTLKNLREVFVK